MMLWNRLLHNAGTWNPVSGLFLANLDAPNFDTVLATAGGRRIAYHAQCQPRASALHAAQGRSRLRYGLRLVLCAPPVEKSIVDTEGTWRCTFRGRLRVVGKSEDGQQDLSQAQLNPTTRVLSDAGATCAVQGDLRGCPRRVGPNVQPVRLALSVPSKSCEKSFATKRASATHANRVHGKFYEVRDALLCAWLV